MGGFTGTHVGGRSVQVWTAVKWWVTADDLEVISSQGNMNEVLEAVPSSKVLSQKGSEEHLAAAVTPRAPADVTVEGLALVARPDPT
ncbi:hypothetical protein H920_12223 [Fukomys damarensis]|uniref:Uncharacterized protein n=1 Tax=Fukomys damarensis TaxID=885580 RepID=A0A091DUE9_FUKDA|nr:hypothetical protein H920_12223 [Fukomys damarensis]